MSATEQNELSMLRLQVAQLTVKTVTAQAENRRLRRLTANGRVGRLLERTAADARQLCAWRWASYSVSRDACYSYGMSRRRWHWAVALLERARVVRSDAKYLDDAFEVDDFADAIAAIDKTAAVLQERGIDALVMRLPRNGYSGRKQSRN